MPIKAFPKTKAFPKKNTRHSSRIHEQGHVESLDYKDIEKIVDLK